MLKEHPEAYIQQETFIVSAQPLRASPLPFTCDAQPAVQLAAEHSSGPERVIAHRAEPIF